MKSAPLLHRLRRAGLVVHTQGPVEDLELGHLAADSRQVEPGSLFVAIRGTQTDGHRFIDQASPGDMYADAGLSVGDIAATALGALGIEAPAFGKARA